MIAATRNDFFRCGEIMKGWRRGAAGRGGEQWWQQREASV